MNSKSHPDSDLAHKGRKDATDELSARTRFRWLDSIRARILLGGIAFIAIVCALLLANQGNDAVLYTKLISPTVASGTSAPPAKTATKSPSSSQR